MIHVLKPGLLTTIQDLGRFGFAHIGLSPAGAADPFSFRMANLLLGNAPNTPALEFTLTGPTLEFDERATIAISGSCTSISLPINQPFEVAPGEKIIVGSLLDGARAYLAVRGGFRVPVVMNSCSTFLPAKMGGFNGRALKAGDGLGIGTNVLGPCRQLRPDFLKESPGKNHGILRVTRSSQSDWFRQQDNDVFQGQVFTVSDACNRSGVRLRGDPIVSDVKRELLTEGVALGAVQVPPDGQPIILFVDQQTTGGYPKIANVIAADIPHVGQLRPRDQVRFHFVTIPEAVALLRQREDSLQRAFSA